MRRASPVTSHTTVPFTYGVWCLGWLGNRLHGDQNPRSKRNHGVLWLAFLRSVAERGLSGVELVTSDAHRGLRDAIATVFGGASWQRCRTHFMTNLLTRVPRRAQPWVATMVRTVYQQPSPEEVHAQLDRVIDQLENRFPQAVSVLAEAGPDILAFTAFPVAHWKQVWSNNPLERLNEGDKTPDRCGRHLSEQADRASPGWAPCSPNSTMSGRFGRRYLTPAPTCLTKLCRRRYSHNQLRLGLHHQDDALFTS